MRYYTVQTQDKDIVVSAHNAQIRDGALVFIDKYNQIIRAYAPGQWEALVETDTESGGDSAL